MSDVHIDGLGIRHYQSSDEIRSDQTLQNRLQRITDLPAHLRRHKVRCCCNLDQRLWLEPQQTKEGTFVLRRASIHDDHKIWCFFNRFDLEPPEPWSFRNLELTDQVVFRRVTRRLFSWAYARAYLAMTEGKDFWPSLREELIIAFYQKGGAFPLATKFPGSELQLGFSSFSDLSASRNFGSTLTFEQWPPNGSRVLSAFEVEPAVLQTALSAVYSRGVIVKCDHFVVAVVSASRAWLLGFVPFMRMPTFGCAAASNNECRLVTRFDQAKMRPFSPLRLDDANEVYQSLMLRLNPSSYANMPSLTYRSDYILPTRTFIAVGEQRGHARGTDSLYDSIMTDKKEVIPRLPKTRYFEVPPQPEKRPIQQGFGAKLVGLKSGSASENWLLGAPACARALLDLTERTVV